MGCIMENNIETLKLLRDKFVRYFDRHKLETMTVDEYSLNSENNALSKESFCYWVETKLRGLGSMQGATSLKFGTYYGLLKPDTTYRRRWIGWASESFETIRKELLNLYDPGEAEDIEAIQRNLLSPMFKGKLLSLYFPQRYLNIFDTKHLRHFLNKLSIPNKPNDNPVMLREFLIAYKQSVSQYAKMDAIDFGHTLYAKYGNPSEDEVQYESAEELYELSHKHSIRSFVKNLPEYSNIPEAVPEQIETSYGLVYKIDPAKSRRALFNANFLCEADYSHESFTRRDEKNRYTEAHHLIPRSNQRYYGYSLDVIANIISLCSNCHNCLHYGSKDERETILARLYFSRHKLLEEVGLKITLDELKKLY